LGLTLAPHLCCLSHFLLILRTGFFAFSNPTGVLNCLYIPFRNHSPYTVWPRLLTWLIVLYCLIFSPALVSRGNHSHDVLPRGSYLSFPQGRFSSIRIFLVDSAAFAPFRSSPGSPPARPMFRYLPCFSTLGKKIFLTPMLVRPAADSHSSFFFWAPSSLYRFLSPGRNLLHVLLFFLTGTACDDGTGFPEPLPLGFSLCSVTETHHFPLLPGIGPPLLKVFFLARSLSFYFSVVLL